MDIDKRKNQVSVYMHPHEPHHQQDPEASQNQPSKFSKLLLKKKSILVCYYEWFISVLPSQTPSPEQNAVKELERINRDLQERLGQREQSQFNLKL